MTSQPDHVSVKCDGEGEMGAYFAQARGAGRGALVVVQEIFGVNAAMREIAQDLAAEGYTVIVPDIFWRLEPGVELGNGEPGPLRDKAIDLMRRYNTEVGLRDLETAAEWLRVQTGAIKVGIVGFCLGGKLAALVAANGKVDAGCVFYGVGLDAHLNRLRHMRVPTEFHFGANDSQIPPATVEAVRGATSLAAAKCEVYIYPGADHAFFNRYRADRFHPQSHKLARDRMLGFLARVIG